MRKIIEEKKLKLETKINKIQDTIKFLEGLMKE